MSIGQAFAERNYEKLIEWYLLNGDNMILQMQLQGEVDEFLKGWLLEAIEPLLPKEVKTRKEKSLHEEMMQQPENVQAVYNQNREYFRLMKEARLGVPDADGGKTKFGIFDEDKEVRAEAAKLVVKYARLNKEGWMDIDHYKKFGYMPSALSKSDEVMAMTVAEAVKQLKLDENYVRKYTAKARKMKGAERENLEASIKSRQDRVTLINKKFELC